MTLSEALDYLRPHPLTKGPITLQSQKAREALAVIEAALPGPRAAGVGSHPGLPRRQTVMRRDGLHHPNLPGCEMDCTDRAITPFFPICGNRGLPWKKCGRQCGTQHDLPTLPGPGLDQHWHLRLRPLRRLRGR